MTQRAGYVEPGHRAGAAPAGGTILATSSEPATGQGKPLSQGYISYALWMLLIVYTLNFLDRQIVNILAGPIKADLNLSNTQLGLLTGLAFAFVYTVLGIPIARFADKFSSSRVGVISIALAVWSGFTALCGFAQNYWHLLAARIGVGVGEAGCTPPAHSLIADTVAPEKRASALAFYSMGVPIGTFFGFAFGGWIAEHLGWRWAFILVGTPGIVLAIITWLTLKEPRRLGLVKPPSANAPTLSFGAALKALGGIRSYWFACFAAAVLSFIGYGQAAFLGLFYGEVHKMPVGQIGLALGTVIGVAGALGTFVGGMVADAAAKRDTRAYFSVPAMAMIAAAPFFIAAMFMHSGAPGLSGGWTDGTAMSLMLLAIPTFLNSLWYGPVYASVQGVVSPQLRASAVAIMLFIVNMIGLGLGPTVLGILADILAQQNLAALGFPALDFGDACRAATDAAKAARAADPSLTAACKTASAEGVRWAIVATSAMGLLAVALFWMARGTIREDLARAKAAA